MHARHVPRTIMAALVAVGLAVPLATPAGAVPATCTFFGIAYTATLQGSGTITGTQKDDVICERGR